MTVVTGAQRDDVDGSKPLPDPRVTCTFFWDDHIVRLDHPAGPQALDSAPAPTDGSSRPCGSRRAPQVG